MRSHGHGIDAMPVLLGNQIRKIRSRRGYSQEQLAVASGLHRTYIGVVERGEKNITIANCSRIALALGVKLSELISIVESNSRK